MRITISACCLRRSRGCPRPSLKLEDAVRLNPGSVKSRFVLGMLYGAANRLDDAAAMFRDVLQRDPSQPARGTCC